MLNEDPYKSFRRSLIADTRKSGSPRGTSNAERMHTAASKASIKAPFGDFSIENSESNIKSFDGLPRKDRNSMININANKVSFGTNTREIKLFLDDISNEKIRQSADSSYMMIEVSDLEIKEPISRPSGGGDYGLKMPP